MATHFLFKHRERMADHGKGEHGHMVPPLFLLAEKLNEVEIDEGDFARARRDLLGFVGLKTAAARGKFKAEEVFPS